jgi:hypothetical protein
MRVAKQCRPCCCSRPACAHQHGVEADRRVLRQHAGRQRARVRLHHSHARVAEAVRHGYGLRRGAGPRAGSAAGRARPQEAALVRGRGAVAGPRAWARGAGRAAAQKRAGHLRGHHLQVNAQDQAALIRRAQLLAGHLQPCACRAAAARVCQRRSCSALVAHRAQGLAASLATRPTRAAPEVQHGAACKPQSGAHTHAARLRHRVTLCAARCCGPPQRAERGWSAPGFINLCLFWISSSLYAARDT